MKIFMIASLSLAMISTAHADTLLGVYGGIGRWQSSLDGDVGDQRSAITSVDNLGFNRESSDFAWIALEHFIPVLPNLRLEYAGIDGQAESTNQQVFTIGGRTFTTEIPMQTNLDLVYYDATIYYELLDNWISLDLGLTARKFDGSVQVETDFGRATGDLDDTIPMGYVSGGVQFPGTNASVNARLKAVSFDGDRMFDYSLSAGYAFDVLPLLDLGVNIGYRSLTLESKQFGNMYADIDANGIFAEVYFHF